MRHKHVTVGGFMARTEFIAVGDIRGLSRARVNAIGNTLMAEGLSRKMVVRHRFCESLPRVPTTVGNGKQGSRRVEITFER